jgi:threonine/homoserine/homoserine lactone efflux protein
LTRYLIFGFTFAFAAAVQPGPFQAFLVAQTMTAGWRRTAVAAFAPLLSDGPIIVLVLLVLSQVPPGFVQVLQIGGGLFLLFLASRALRACRDYAALQALAPPSHQQTLLKAALVNLLNPNPYLGWSLVMGPLFLQGWRERPAHGIALLVSFYTTMVICLFGTVLLLAAARNLGPRVGRILTGASAVALAGFGLYSLGAGLRAFIAG